MTPPMLLVVSCLELFVPKESTKEGKNKSVITLDTKWAKMQKPAFQNHENHAR